MIPVQQKPEPPWFDADVRQPGLAWLKEKGIPPEGPKPKKVELTAYWTKSLDDLHSSYDGICAYLCHYIERVMGGASVDHFVAKSLKPGMAYEWSNYRLASMGFNRNKGVEHVLDPFTLKPDTFRLELVTGRIYPESSLPAEEKAAAQKTIDALELDGASAREHRTRHYSDYLEVRASPAAEGQLRRDSPFIWYEANRQGLL